MDQRRVQRGLRERMFVMDVECDEGMMWQFLVQGTTGNTYTVLLSPLAASCECIDCLTRQRVCKHIIFILGRVAGLGEEVAEYLESEELIGQPFVSEMINDMLTRAVANRISEKESEEDMVERDEACAICFETKFDPSKELQCKTCKKVFHTACMRQWWNADKSTCPTCRASFPRPLFSPGNGEDVFFRF